MPTMFEGWSTLRHRDFALACGARFAVTLALHIVTVSIGWYIYDVTASPWALGYLGLAGLGPAVVLALFTGFVADRIERRLIMFACDLALTVTALALLWLVAGGSGLVWPIYLIIVFAAAARAFHNPAAQAIIPTLVPTDLLPRALAFASGSFQAAQILGPAIGGLAYAVDPRLAFLLAGTLYALSAIAALAIRHRAPPDSGRLAITFASLMAGFQFTWRKPVVLGAVSLDAMVVLFGGVVLLLPIFAKDILQVGPQGLGLLRAGPAIGAVLMAAWLAHNDYVKRNAGAKLFRTVALFGAATVLFGLSETFWLSLACLILVGAADMVSVVIRHTLVQSETPNVLRGRVSAVNSLFITSSSELSQFRAGALAGLLGAVPAVVVGGIAAVGLALVWPRLFPALAKRDHLIESAAVPAKAKP